MHAVPGTLVNEKYGLQRYEAYDTKQRILKKQSGFKPGLFGIVVVTVLENGLMRALVVSADHVGWYVTVDAWS